MAIELISNRDLSQGLHVLFVYVNDLSNGLLMPLVIFGFWIVLLMGMFFSKERKTGVGDMPVCAAVAGFSTTVLTVMFKLVPGLINNMTLTIVIIVSVISVLWAFFSKE